MVHRLLAGPNSTPGAWRFLGYSGGRGNYKVQNIETRRVFVSRDVIFEEGHPHHTSPSVGENLPLFNTILEETPLNNGETTNNSKAMNDGEMRNQSGNTTKQTDHITDSGHHENHDNCSVDIPAEPNCIPMEPNQQTPALRRSPQVPQPSGNSLQS